jgi:2-dehydro-3-deoxyphosphogluconate aldolase / (4S)-4-hydroxy-2-oxoglutarate aldolase
MSQRSIKNTLQPHMPIAIVRLENLEDALEISGALLAGGITTVEFTLTNAKANEVITQVRRAFGDRMVIGAGTVLDSENARASVAAGAQFLVTPIVALDVVATGIELDIPVVCGAYTPTEIWTAWRAGASLVKVFPSSQLGPTYFKDVLAPLPDLLLVPTGGVNLDTCGAFLAAGAYTVAVGGNLVSKNRVKDKDWTGLTALASQYIDACC